LIMWRPDSVPWHACWRHVGCLLSATYARPIGGASAV
jgi:hypothetical protein